MTPPCPTVSHGDLTAWVGVHLAEQERRGLHPRTLAERRRVLGWLVTWCHRHFDSSPVGLDRPLVSLDRPTIARFQQALATPDGPQGAAALPYSRQVTTASHLRQFGHFLVARGVLALNPCGALAVPRLGFSLPGQVLSLPQVAALLDGIDLTAPHGLRDRALLEVAYALGASSEALARLRVADLDPAPDHPYRIGAWVTLGPRAACAPGSLARRLPLGQRAWGWVHRYLTEGRPACAAREVRRGGQATALVLSQWGHPLHRRDVNLIVATYLRRAGLPSHGSTRLLRDSLAVHLIDAGCDLRVVAQVLGLEDFGSVRRYAAASGGLLRDLHARFHPAERGLVPDVGRRDAPLPSLPST